MQIVQSAMVFPVVFLPIAVDMSIKHEYIKMLSFVRTALLTALVGLVPSGLFFYYCSSWLIRILFKPEYTGAATATTLLCMGMVFFTLGTLFLQIMLSLHKTVPMALIAVVTTVCSLILNYFFIIKADVNGAANATLLSYALFAFLTYITLEYYIKRLRKEDCEKYRESPEMKN
jgi:O-antigen/teichoic acid export membrane protein